MTPLSNERPNRALAAMLCIALLASFGCGKKITAVDPKFTVPEGESSNASILVVYRNLGNRAFFFQEFKPISVTEPEGPSPGDTLAATALAVSGTNGVVRGLVFDSTAASGYQIFTREANGGLRQLFDYRLQPSQRWLDTQWEKYSFTDEQIEPDPAYQARGLVAGVASTASPVSNPASSPFANFSDLYNIRVMFSEPQNGSVQVTWLAVPGAAGYFLHLYNFRADWNRSHDLELQVATGAPAPICDVAVRDAFLAYYVAEGTSCSLGSLGDRVLSLAGLTSGGLVRVSAIDCSGRLIGFSSGEFPVIFDPPLEAFEFATRPERISYMIYFFGGYRFPRPVPAESPALASRLRGEARFRASPATGKRITFRIPYSPF